MKVFLLDDDNTLGFGIKTYLEKNRYMVTVCKSLAEAKKKFEYDYDIVILDINLPDGNGYDFLDIFDIKQMPVLFLTVNDAEEDIVRGLNVSDGYLTKPFKLSVLKAKIESILRRVDSKEVKLNYKTLVIDEKNYKCLIDGKDINLTNIEYNLLKLLLLNRGNTLTRNQILEKIWDSKGAYVEDNTLTATVKRLRHKLGNYSYTIETVRGVGYRFVRD